MSVVATGYGFGTRTLPWANCARLVVGEAAPASAPGVTRTPEGAAERDGFVRDAVVVIESNIDNMTGEALGWLLERLLAEGALDVSYAPLQMKKHRPGVLLTVIAAPNDAERLAGLILRESATLGVRLRTSERLIAGRRVEQIETPLGPARVKLKLAGEQVIAVAPEYDDLRELAARVGLPLEAVAAQVTHAARRHFGLDV